MLECPVNANFDDDNDDKFHLNNHGRAIVLNFYSHSYTENACLDIFDSD